MDGQQSLHLIILCHYGWTTKPTFDHSVTMDGQQSLHLIILCHYGWTTKPTFDHFLTLWMDNKAYI